MTIFGRSGLPQDLMALYTPFLVAASPTQLTIKEGTQISLINAGDYKLGQWTADTTFAVADALDTGSIAPGKDYYVYLCWDGLIKVSLNSTYPSGYSATTSRKIGGFHTLSCAVGTIASHTLTGFATGAILPNSVWCLNFRAKSGNEGMVYVGQIPNSTPLAPKGPNIWVDIYLQSGTGVNTISAYGGAVVDSRVWHDHVEDQGYQEKRLLSDYEFALAAEGSNAKTNIYGSLKPVLGLLTVGYAGKCAPAAFTGAGLNDILVNRTAYVPPGGATNESQEYEIEVDATGTPDTVKWKKRVPGGSYGSYTTGVSMVGGVTIDGVVFSWNATTGHTLGNKWNVTVMNGLVDTANRRMISNYGVEAAAGVYWQWLLDQSYRYDMDAAPVLTAVTQTAPVYDIASPGGNQVYMKYALDGQTYLCSNLATLAASTWITMGNHKVQIAHDASAAVGGLPVYIKKANAIVDRLVVNNTITGKDAVILSTQAGDLCLKIKHDAGAASNVALNFDDGADMRLEANMTGGNTTIDLAFSSPTWAYQDLGSNKGSFQKQGTYGDVKLLAGGAWANGASCGPRCRIANSSRWNAITSLGGRGCAEPRRS